MQVPPLHGKHVVLTPLQEADIPVLRKLARDERLWEFTKTLIIDDSYDRQFDEYITTALNPGGHGEQFSFVIRRAEDGSIIGMTRFYDHNAKDKRVAIGYTWYVPEVWGQVHNKECKLLLLRLAFDEWKFNRVEFHVAHQNIRSQKAVQKIGGRLEGVLRKFMIRNDGSIRHTVVFSIIDDEWPEVKVNLEKLLDQS